MKISIKLKGSLYDEMIRDLMRQHPFASERVGFVLGRMGSLANGSMILLNRYHSIPDDQYIDDPTVGARIGSGAMTWAMQATYYGRAAREGVFHVHLHDCDGPTGMSRTDRSEIPSLIPGFQSVSRDAAHGILILSRNHGSSWVWLPGSKESQSVDTINVIGVPVGVFERRI
jgi:hypothetical protein